MKQRDKRKLFKLFKIFLNEADDVEDFGVRNNEFYLKIKPKEIKE